MLRPAKTGVLSLSIELGTGAAVETRRLLDVLAHHNFPATWAIGDPATCAETHFIRDAAVEHEIAILGDATWIGPRVRRATFCRELVRRVLQAREQGIAIATLALRGTRLDAHHDLLLKHEIAVLRTCSDAAEVIAQPQPVRYGLWEVAPSISLPTRSRWKFGFGGWTAVRRTLQRAIDGRQTVHVALDLAGVDEQDVESLKLTERMIRFADEHRRLGLLSIEPLRDTSARLAPKRTTTPARSILRIAA